LGCKAFSGVCDALISLQRSPANGEKVDMSKPSALEAIAFARQFGIFVHQLAQIGCPEAAVDMGFEPSVLQILVRRQRQRHG
jgi:hypothetical protein